ncbi:MAG: M23 family metallopeptidase [Pseudomonadota bacterium]
MRFAFGQTLSSLVGFVAVALVPVAPAAANSSANTSAEVVAPIEEAQEEALAKGDPSFRNLFARWTALDTAGPDPFATDVSTKFPQPVAVPSRSPLDFFRVTSNYGMRVHPILRRRKQHNGIDLGAPTGTPVYATADGAVSRADRSRTYGLVVYLDHGGDLETRYAHLSKLLVADGQIVRKGDLIGHVGSTGRSSGPHLHYEVRVDGVAVNPIPYMKEGIENTRTETDRLAQTSGRTYLNAK